MERVKSQDQLLGLKTIRDAKLGAIKEAKSRLRWVVPDLGDIVNDIQLVFDSTFDEWMGDHGHCSIRGVPTVLGCYRAWIRIIRGT